MLGALLATAAAVTNAAAFVVVRQIKAAQHTLVLTWWYHGVVVLFAAVPLLAGYPAPAVRPGRRDAALLAVVGATQFGGQLLLNRGFQLESATRGSAVNVLQVLFSFVWNVAVLGVAPSILSVAGSSLVAAGVLAVALTRPVGRHAAGRAGHADAPAPADDGGLLQQEHVEGHHADAQDLHGAAQLRRPGGGGRRSGTGEAGSGGGSAAGAGTAAVGGVAAGDALAVHVCVGGGSQGGRWSGTGGGSGAGSRRVSDEGDGDAEEGAAAGRLASASGPWLGLGLREPLLVRLAARMSLDTAT